VLPLEGAEQVRTGGQHGEGELRRLARHRRRLRDTAAGLVVGVEELGQEPDQAGGQDVDGHARDDVVHAQGDRGDRVQQPAEGAEEQPAQHGRAPAPLVAGEAGSPGAQDHHPVQADVDHAGTFGEQTTEGGQADRHGQQQRPRHHRGRRERLLAADHAHERDHDQPAEDPPGHPPSTASPGEQIGEGPTAGLGSRCRRHRAHA
jgi:hypothetical protein